MAVLFVVKVSVAVLFLKNGLAGVAGGETGLHGYFHILEFNGAMAAGIGLTSREVAGHVFCIAMDCSDG